MGIRLLAVFHAKQFLRRPSWVIPGDVPKGYCGVYVGDQSQKKRFVIPISYLKDPEFQDLLSKAQEEFGYNHATGGLGHTMPDLCSSLDIPKLAILGQHRSGLKTMRKSLISLLAIDDVSG
ncbi:hypothetical protein FEM48_Zijuj09G0106500 [Ziziphus jujuba var. spinosa]|uniref:Uncharacterized protein n=1 Tax=Ziziphus jujuba var. spinosa TaxID=714518 RepID=A0A978USI6_ZIZJJ|nr:hypothetical protein FEM48_Zijuj09G0106500 [Ziziphus jujuba var. spinosa]